MRPLDKRPLEKVVGEAGEVGARPLAESGCDWMGGAGERLLWRGLETTD